jgi:hypothetical protein
MTPIVWNYVGYLALAITLTVWVAKTLHKNGRIFLVDSFIGNEALADSVNHLLVVGFYLVNLGYVAFALKTDNHPVDLQGVIETLSAKIGAVLLVLGGMHFFNLYVFSKMRQRALLKDAALKYGVKPAAAPPMIPRTQAGTLNP